MSLLCCASGLYPLLSWHLRLSVHYPLSPSSPNQLVGRSRTSISDTPPACNPAVGAPRQVDRGIRQADRQDALRELDGVLEAHQGDVCTGDPPPGVHRVGLHPGDTHRLGPLARVPQLPGPQQHRELGRLVQVAGRKGERWSQPGTSRWPRGPGRQCVGTGTYMKAPGKQKRLLGGSRVSPEGTEDWTEGWEPGL